MPAFFYKKARGIPGDTDHNSQPTPTRFPGNPNPLLLARLVPARCTQHQPLEQGRQPRPQSLGGAILSMGDAVGGNALRCCPMRTQALLSDFNEIIDRASQSIICMKYRGIRIPARMREPLLAVVGNGRGTGRDLQDSSTPTAATRHISMPPATEETCHTAQMLRVCLSVPTITSLVLPVLRLNSGLVRVQRCWRIAHATVAQGGVHCSSFTLACRVLL